MKHKFFTKRHRRLLLGAWVCLCLAVLFCLLAQWGIGIPCPFYWLTGLSCPGCGNSRAVLALLRLDIAAALQYNFMFPVEFFYIAWVLFHSCRNYLRFGRFSYQPKPIWLDIGILALILLWWPLRNIL